jgi:hypothetical protein
MSLQDKLMSLSDKSINLHEVTLFPQTYPDLSG